MKLPDRAARAIILAAVFAPMVLTGIFSILRLFVWPPPVEDIEVIDVQLRAALYTGGATLIGLAAFGSVIGAGVIAGKNKNVLNRGVMLMVGGAGGVIMTQLFLMLNACCGVLYVEMFWTWVLATAVYSGLIVFGFAYIVDMRFNLGSKDREKEQLPTREGGQDGGQSGAPDGAATELHLLFDLGRGTVDMSFTNSGGNP